MSDQHRQAVAEAQAEVTRVMEEIRSADQITDELRTRADSAIATLNTARGDLERVEALQAEAEVARQASEIAAESSQAARQSESPSERLNAALRNPNDPQWRGEGEMDGMTVPALEVSLRAANNYRDAIKAGVSGDEIVRAAERGQALAVAPNGDFRSVNVGTDGQGGYLVPTTLSTEMIRQMYSVPSLRTAGCRMIRTADGQEWSLTLATLDPTGELASGSDPTANVTAESAQYDEIQPTWDRRTFKAYKLTANVPITKEAFADSQFDIASEVGFLCGEVIATKEAFLTMRGDGSDEHEGLVHNTSIARTERATQSSWDYKDLDKAIRVFNGKRAAYRNGLRIMMSLSDLDEILTTFTANVGFNFGVQNAFEASYRRIPAVDNLWLEAEGTTDNVLACIANFQRLYAIREVQSVRIMSNPYIRMSHGEIVYYADYRSDGKVLDTRAGQFIDEK